MEKGAAAWLACLAVLAISLAGCLETPEDEGGELPQTGGDDEPTSKPTMPPAKNTSSPIDKPPQENRPMQLQNCEQSVITAEVPKDWVEPHMPAGFNLTIIAETLTEVYVYFYLCEAIVLDNETLLVNESFALVAVSVAVDQELAGDSLTQDYVFEAWLKSPRLAEEFRRAGVAQTRWADEISREPSETGLLLAVTANGTRTIEVDMPVTQPQYENEFAMSSRFFYHGSPYRWMDQQLDFERTLHVLDTGLLKYSGETLSLFTGKERGELPIFMARDYMSGTATFGEA